MADGLPVTPGAAPASPPTPVGQGGVPGQPPIGSSPMTLPTPNRGLQASALSQVKEALNILEKALPGLGSTSEPGKQLLRIIGDLAKMTPPGSTSQGIQGMTLQNLMSQSRQDGPLQAALRAMSAGNTPANPAGAGGAGAPSPSPAGPPAMPPST